MAATQSTASTRHPTSASVPSQLVRLLRELRDRGRIFELAWEFALTQIVWPVSQRETAEWERALEGTKQAWRARYEGWEPTPSEEAVAGLVEFLRQRAAA